MHFELTALEFNHILDKIKDYANMNDTKEEILNIKPTSDINHISRMLDDTDEMRKYIVSYGDLPFGGMTSIKSKVIYASKNMILNEEDLINIKNYILGCNNIRDCKNNLSFFTNIYNYVLELIDLKFLAGKISKAISDEMQIYDHASNDLFKIRTTIKSLNNRLRGKMNELLIKEANKLSNNTIVLRNDRLCLAVKQEYKNTFKGIIHDESQSKTTCYIEPIECVNISNQILTATNAEKEEIKRILQELSMEVMFKAEELLKNIEIISHLDLLHAKARYAIFTNSIKPRINDKGIIDLKKARHPLIDPNNVKALDVTLGKTYKTIVITGPNTGGKTVSLKTVGLLTIMMQSGILVLANEANMAVFDNVFVDIGDDQSILQSLSTFSSHMSKICNIVNNLTINSLILLDELGGGTDPIEGSSLAIALLKYFMERDSRIIVTTHYQALKEFAYENDNVINASMEFSSQTYLPTYKLLIGVSGKSNAFLISRNLGLDERIIEDANNILKNNQTKSSQLMEKIEIKGDVLEKNINEYEELIKINNELKANYERKLEELSNDEEKILKNAKKKAEKIYLDAKNEALELIKEIEGLLNEQTKMHEIADLKYKAKSLEVKKEEVNSDFELNVGDYVTVIPYECLGQVIKINKDKYLVQFGNLSSEFKKTDLKPNKTVKEKKILTKKSAPKSTMPEKSGKMSLDLRGKRYLDAIDELDKFIDSALYSNISQVTIIHGFGTGAIRKGVHEYLKKCPHVESFRYGGEGEGLNGATIATLK